MSSNRSVTAALLSKEMWVPILKGLKHLNTLLYIRVLLEEKSKLDGVGPVNNRPSTNYLHYVGEKKAI